MPITPFHFGPGAAVHAIAPRHISFLAFCAANVLIDVETLYYMLTRQYPWHRFFHTYVGATIIVVATVVLFAALLKLASGMSLPNLFGSVAGCNTVEGAGKDIQQGGKAIKDEANEHKTY